MALTNFLNPTRQVGDAVFFNQRTSDSANASIFKSPATGTNWGFDWGTDDFALRFVTTYTHYDEGTAWGPAIGDFVRLIAFQDSTAPLQAGTNSMVLGWQPSNGKLSFYTNINGSTSAPSIANNSIVASGQGGTVAIGLVRSGSQIKVAAVTSQRSTSSPATNSPQKLFTTTLSSVTSGFDEWLGSEGFVTIGGRHNSSGGLDDSTGWSFGAFFAGQLAGSASWSAQGAYDLFSDDDALTFFLVDPHTFASEFQGFGEKVSWDLCDSGGTRYNEKARRELAIGDKLCDLHGSTGDLTLTQYGDGSTVYTRGAYQACTRYGRHKTGISGAPHGFKYSDDVYVNGCGYVDNANEATGFLERLDGDGEPFAPPVPIPVVSNFYDNGTATKYDWSGDIDNTESESENHWSVSVALDSARQRIATFSYYHQDTRDDAGDWYAQCGSVSVFQDGQAPTHSKLDNAFTSSSQRGSSYGGIGFTIEGSGILVTRGGGQDQATTRIGLLAGGSSISAARELTAAASASPSPDFSSVNISPGFPFAVHPIAGQDRMLLLFMSRISGVHTFPTVWGVTVNPQQWDEGSGWVFDMAGNDISSGVGTTGTNNIHAPGLILISSDHVASEATDHPTGGWDLRTSSGFDKAVLGFNDGVMSTVVAGVTYIGVIAWETSDRLNATDSDISNGSPGTRELDDIRLYVFTYANNALTLSHSHSLWSEAQAAFPGDYKSTGAKDYDALGIAVLRRSGNGLTLLNPVSNGNALSENDSMNTRYLGTSIGAVHIADWTASSLSLSRQANVFDAADFGGHTYITNRHMFGESDKTIVEVNSTSSASAAAVNPGQPYIATLPALGGAPMNKWWLWKNRIRHG